MWSMCLPTILGWCAVRPSLRMQAGIRSREFFGAASDSRSALDLESDTSADSDGGGDIGGTTGMTVEHSTTITPSNRTAESSVTTGFITVISITATLATAGSGAALTTETSATE